MSANANSAPKSAEKPARRLLVRLNATLFHCLGAAVLLEHAGAVAAARMPDVQSSEMWAAERRNLVQWLSAYARAVWPEFEWDAACASIADMAQQLPANRNLVAAIDHTMLFYRALSAIAEDAELARVLAQIASIDESRRDARRVTVRPGLGGTLRRFGSAHAYVEHARNRTVRTAFDVLQRHWSDGALFPASEYETFLLRAYAVLAPHMRLDWRRRLLYRGWLTWRATCATRPASARLLVRTRDAAANTEETHARPACALPSSSVVR